VMPSGGRGERNGAAAAAAVVRGCSCFVIVEIACEEGVSCMVVGDGPGGF
jgi:hypothetical protein